MAKKAAKKTGNKKEPKSAAGSNEKNTGAKTGKKEKIIGIDLGTSNSAAAGT